MSGMSAMSEETFTRHRGLLFTIAYEMLGSLTDAEDVVQETWLRWSGADHEEIRDPRAYLVRIVTRQALNRLRTLARRREDYVGDWLPEPLVTSDDVAADVELAEGVSLAMLTVLETLTPAERAVFVLREVFDTPYEEIARAVDKSPAAVRQIAHRARDHVADRRPRMVVTAAEQQEVVERFLQAIRGGDLDGLLAVLAPDVVAITDGGGIVPAGRGPVHGALRVARFFIATANTGRFVASAVSLNGSPGTRIDTDAGIDSALGFAIEGGRITRIYAIRNPNKLAGLDGVATLTRN